MTRHGKPVVEFKPVPVKVGPSATELQPRRGYRRTDNSHSGRGLAFSLYLDASAPLSPFLEEASTSQAHESPRDNVLIFRDFAIAAFSSGVARRAWLGENNDSGAANVSAALDTWSIKATRREMLTTGGVHVAISLLRRLEVGLRASAAVNIARAQGCASTHMTFDERMARSARSLGTTVIN